MASGGRGAMEDNETFIDLVMIQQGVKKERKSSQLEKLKSCSNNEWYKRPLRLRLDVLFCWCCGERSGWEAFFFCFFFSRNFIKHS